MKHLLSIEEMAPSELEDLINLGEELKNTRGKHARPLDGQCWGLIFTKSSTRTRVSFEVGVRELGGHVMFLSNNDLQLGRGEPIKDTARVLGRMLHGVIIRTFDQQDIVDVAEFGKIPVINALTDDEHPCQILADLLTMKEKLGGWKGKRVCFYGDGDCNVAKSWMWAAEKLKFNLVIAAPKEFQPNEAYLNHLGSEYVTCEEDPEKATENIDVLYTDVWVSMGKEEESAGRLAKLAPYQLNTSLYNRANEGALVMHCLPAYRDKEITEELLEAHADTIFQEAENRLHAQKAVLTRLGC